MSIWVGLPQVVTLSSGTIRIMQFSGGLPVQRGTQVSTEVIGSSPNARPYLETT